MWLYSKLGKITEKLIEHYIYCLDVIAGLWYKFVVNMTFFSCVITNFEQTKMLSGQVNNLKFGSNVWTHTYANFNLHKLYFSKDILKKPLWGNVNLPLCFGSDSIIAYFELHSIFSLYLLFGLLPILSTCCYLANY